MNGNVITLVAISILMATVLTSAAMLGIQSVAALTDATSTEPVVPEVAEEAGETEGQPAENLSELGAPLDESATAVATTTVTAGEPEPATPTPPAATSTDALPSTSIAEVAAGKPDKAEVMADASALQENYYQQTGSYLQILRGNGLPTYESGTVAEKLGTVVSDDVWVHVYEAPAGKGYQVFYEDAGGLHAVGYGPEAAERTFSRPKADLTATSTSNSVF